MNTTRDPRWIIITENGEWGPAGHHTDPLRQGDAGWLATASGPFNSGDFPEIIMRRILGSPSVPFEAAIEALKARLRHDQGGDEPPLS